MEHGTGMTESQCAELHERGYLILPGLLPRAAIQPLTDDLAAAVEQEVEQLVIWERLDRAATFADEPFDRRLAAVAAELDEESLAWLWRRLHSKRHKTAGMYALRTHPALLDAVESVIGPEILAHPQTVLRVKLPEHEPADVPWHQDDEYLAEDIGDTVILNLWIPLATARRENGCLEVIAGSHRQSVPHRLKTSIPGVVAYRGINDEDLPDGERVTCEMQPGDALMTMERVAHRSLPNTSSTVRWSLDTRYCRLGAPTGRSSVPGFVARSRKHPESVTRNHRQWVSLLLAAGLNPGETGEPAPLSDANRLHGEWRTDTPRTELTPRARIQAGEDSEQELVLEGTGDLHAFGCWHRSVRLVPGCWYRASVQARPENIERPGLSVFAQCAGHFLTPRPLLPSEHKTAPADTLSLECTFRHEPHPSEHERMELYLRAAPTGRIAWSRAVVTQIPQPPARIARIATIRFGEPPAPLSMAEQRERMAAKLDQAGSMGVDIAALTEFSPVQGVPERAYGSWADAAEPVPDGPVCRVLAEAARRHRMHVIAGVICRRGRHVFNTAVLFDRSGELLGCYDKTHLTFGELRAGISCGTEYPVFDLDVGRVALHICYDEWFPEVARYYAHLGAEILFLPVAGGKPITWRTRALDNRLYFVAAATGPPSMIIDSSGVIIAEIHGDGVACADIDLGDRQTNVVPRPDAHARHALHRAADAHDHRRPAAGGPAPADVRRLRGHHRPGSAEMSARDLRFGLIGCGNLGSVHARCVREVGGARFTAFADAVPAAAERLLAEHGGGYATDDASRGCSATPTWTPSTSAPTTTRMRRWRSRPRGPASTSSSRSRCRCR